MSVDSAVVHYSDERFQLLIDSVEDYAIYMLDCAGHVVTWNRGAFLNKGYSSQEVIGRHFRMLFVPEDLAAGAPERELAKARQDGRCAGEGWRLRKNGERFWASFVITAMLDSTGQLVGFAKVTRDLSERKRQEDALLAMDAELRVERDRLHAAAESSMDALYICEAVRDGKGAIEDFIFTYLNSNVEKMVSIPRSMLLGRKMCEMLPMDRERGLFERYKQVVLTGKSLIYEFQVEDERAKSTWVRVQAVKMRDGLAITASDITERKQDEERILYMAQHDVLTGLPNRNLLNDRIGQAIEMAKRYRHKVGVLLVDLDGFKQINDTLGHFAGDIVLFTVAGRLKTGVREMDSVIRIGGDEFVIVVSEISELDDIQHYADNILHKLQSSMVVEGHPILVTGSIGIAAYPESGVTTAELLRQADRAMYIAKRSGKNQTYGMAS